MKFGIAKFGTAVAWVLIVLNLFIVFPGWLATALNWLGIAFIVVHVGEYIVFHKTIAQRDEGPLLAFVMTFFFGVFYWKDIP